ncbi:hypothetical protein ACFQ0B_17945 [Nonomuraea thailandensis]
MQWMLAVETAAITAVMALPGLAGGYLVGWAVTRSLHAAGLTSAASAFAPGVLLPVLGVLVVLAASVLAAWIGSRSLARRSPVADAAPPPRRRTGRRPGRGRRVTATIMIGAGLASSAAVLGMDPADILTTALTGPGCVLVAVGLCVLAPELVAAVNLVLRAVLPAHRAAPPTWPPSTCPPPPTGYGRPSPSSPSSSAWRRARSACRASRTPRAWRAARTARSSPRSTTSSWR